MNKEREIHLHVAKIIILKIIHHLELCKDQQEVKQKKKVYHLIINNVQKCNNFSKYKLENLKIIDKIIHQILVNIQIENNPKKNFYYNMIY